MHILTYGGKKPDTNIDHRRVPNLMTCFMRKGWTADKTCQPGDIVCGELSPGITLIRILLTRESVYHNIAPVAKIDDNFLFRYNIIGHYLINLTVHFKIMQITLIICFNLNVSFDFKK
jgi:uncharacterized protein YijF (DUF1287 family)